MATFKQKYPNNSREVSGTPTIYADDVTLLCKTSLGPVTINLLEIPDNYWNTIYKLYIIDESGDAAGSNITINAGAGQTINNQASYVISTDNAGILVRILGNKEYIVTDSNAVATSGYDQVQDEGINLTKRTILNFTGPGVLAFDDAPNVRTNVRVTGGIQDITHASLLALSAAGTIIEGQLYRVTDPTHAYNLVVTGISTTEISTQCMAKWLVTDYQGVGSYTTVPAFNAAIGIWNLALAPAVGDVCIWNNRHYVNGTGANGAVPPDADAVNWTFLAKTNTNGYVLEAEMGLYHFADNYIIRRFDKRANDIEYCDAKGVLLWDWFPFGSDKAKSNRFIGNQTNCVGISNILGGSSGFNSNVVRGNVQTNGYIPPSNLAITFINNAIGPEGTLLFGGSVTSFFNYSNNVVDGSLRILNVASTIRSVTCLNNTIEPGASLQVSGATGGSNLFVERNLFCNNASLLISTVTCTASTYISQNRHMNACPISMTSLVNPATWSRNEINFPGLLAENLGDITDNKYQGGDGSVVDGYEVSNLGKRLDMTSATDYNAGTQTLLLGTNRILGQYWISGGTGNTIAKINGGPYELPFKIIMANAAPTAPTVVLANTAMAVAGTDDLVFNSAMTANLNLDTFAVSGESTTFQRGNGTGASLGPQFVIQQQCFS